MTLPRRALVVAAEDEEEEEAEDGGEGVEVESMSGGMEGGVG